MQQTCHTGGAQGADMLFETVCLSKGIAVKAYSFKGHRSDSRSLVVLSNDELWKADETCNKAAKLLKRSFPIQKPWIANLLRRNYYQVINSDAIFAVGNLLSLHGEVDGGTGWAVAMAKILAGDRRLFVFDQRTEKWYRWSQFYKYWMELKEKPDISLYQDFAGIGTRELTEKGRLAIMELFQEIELRKAS